MWNLGQANPQGGRWAIVDSGGTVVAVIRGRIKTLSTGYTARRLTPVEHEIVRRQRPPGHMRRPGHGPRAMVPAPAAVSGLGEDEAGVF